MALARSGALLLPRGWNMHKPSSDQIAIAAMWLRGNEGDGDEAEACNAVADWIEALGFDSTLRREARAAGVPVKALRRRLKELEG